METREALLEDDLRRETSRRDGEARRLDRVIETVNAIQTREGFLSDAFSAL
ncbi:MAG: hypothetical protein KGL12_12105 [Rhodospirillales bacterium]|nr:hypothetical protein [Rhodospirillales bacterium]